MHRLLLRSGHDDADSGEKHTGTFRHQWYSTAQVQELLDLIAGRVDDVPLDVVALQLATIEYPEVTVEPFLVLLDSYASEFAERVTDDLPGEEFLRRLNAYLFEELEFRGNEADYYNAANSCLNEVLTSRVGIPITLSIVYIEIARRVGREVHGIGLPGHFLVQYVDQSMSVFIDPFHSGRFLEEADCYRIASAATGTDLPPDRAIIQPVSKRHIALRMLNNLRAVYFRREDVPKAIRVLDLLIDALPEGADVYKQRAICRLQLQEFRGAQSDFQTYLRLQPEADDRDQVRAQLMQIKSYLSTLQ